MERKDIHINRKQQFVFYLRDNNEPSAVFTGKPLQFQTGNTIKIQLIDIEDVTEPVLERNFWPGITLSFNIDSLETFEKNNKEDDT